MANPRYQPRPNVRYSARPNALSAGVGEEPSWDLSDLIAHKAGGYLPQGPHTKADLGGAAPTVATSNDASTPDIYLYTGTDYFLTTGGTRFVSASAWRFPVVQLNDALTGGNVSGKAGYAAVAWRTYVQTNSRYVTWIIRGTVDPFRFIVDDQYWDYTGVSMAASGTIYFVTLDLGSTATRVVGVEGQNGAAFRGIALASGATIAKPTSPFRMIWAGDSFIQHNGTYNGNNLGRVCGDYLGIRDVSLSGNAGTGWLSKGSGVDRPYLQQRIADITDSGPWDIIAIPMGLNDITDIDDELFTLADVQEQVQEVKTLLRTAFPNALIPIVGVWDVNAPSAAVSGYAALKAMLQSEADADAGFPFFDLEGVAYTKIGGGDETHPSDPAGNATLGEALFDKFDALFA